VRGNFSEIAPVRICSNNKAGSEEVPALLAITSYNTPLPPGLSSSYVCIRDHYLTSPLGPDTTHLLVCDPLRPMLSVLDLNRWAIGIFHAGCYNATYDRQRACRVSKTLHGSHRNSASHKHIQPSLCRIYDGKYSIGSP
jgi:hypothetical protein